MILETAQLLYTAHWVLAGATEAKGPPPSMATAPAPKGSSTQKGYLPIRNIKHPCAIWTRQSLQHYMWLTELGIALCQEYQHRYGAEKVHSCEEHIYWLNGHPPPGIPNTSWAQPPLAMPDDYKRSRSSIVCYRIYYKENKGALRGILSYSQRHAPHWLKLEN